MHESYNAFPQLEIETNTKLVTMGELGYAVILSLLIIYKIDQPSFHAMFLSPLYIHYIDYPVCGLFDQSQTGCKFSSSWLVCWFVNWFISNWEKTLSLSFL
jgi:hypothetical protein